MSQEFIFTTLPHKRTQIDGKDFLKLSVFCSLRLKPSGASTLKNFPDVLAWPEIVAAADYQFKFGSKTLDAKLDMQRLDPALFDNLFHEQIKVNAFEQENLTSKNIHTVPMLHVRDFVLKNYQKLAIESPARMVTADKFIDPEAFGKINRVQLNEQEINKINSDKTTQPVQMRKLVTEDKDTDKNFKTQLRKDKYVKFSAQMNPKKDFAQLRQFHRIDAKLKPYKPITIKKPEFEFHDILSITTNYPQIARRLGFVLDFLVPFDGSIPATGVVQLIADDLAFSMENTVVSTPPTAYQLTSNGFYVGDRSDSIFKQGFVKINTSQFSVVQMDADGAAMKTQQITENKTKEVARYYQVRSEVQVSKNFKRVKPTQKVEQVTPPQEEGLPAMRSAGIAIVKNGMAEHVFNKFQIAKQLQPKLLDVKLATPVQVQPKIEQRKLKLEKAPTISPMRNLKLNVNVGMMPIKVIYPKETLYSDDVMQGYRLDIAYESDPEKWYSLHQRKNEYTWYDNQNNPHPIPMDESDEGFIELAMTENPDDPDDVYISETLARWEGWSLSVSRPGFSINEADDDPSPNKKDFVFKDRKMEMKKYEFDPDLEFKMNLQSNSVPGTLPRLRFGNDYRLRVRSVDLAGNSVDLTSQTEAPQETVKSNVRYMRYEPLASPIVLVGNELRDGEFLENLVVRSNYDESTDSYEGKGLDKNTYPAHAQRYLLPPKNSQLMAESHSMFEKAMGNNPEAAQEIYSIITSHEGLYKRPDKTKEKVYQPNEVEVIYLPDPMAAGVALFLSEGDEYTHTQVFTPKMFSFFSSDELSSNNTNNVKIPEDWYKAKALTIRLEEGELNTQWDDHRRIFTVFLPKGHRTKIKYSTFWREEDFKELSAIWEMITEKNPSNMSEIEKLAKAGQHWMMSPPRELELVHAVQQPVEQPEIETIYPTREFGETLAEIHTKFKVHGESTEKVMLQAKWIEPIDDGISLEINEEQPGRNFIPEIPVQYKDDQLSFGTVPNKNTVPVHNQLKTIDKIKAIPVQKRVIKTETEFKKDPQPGAKKINSVFKTQETQYGKFQQQKSAAPKNVVNAVKFDLQANKFQVLKDLELRRIPLEHHFGDTKHRWVDYQLVATSRYRDYFDKIFEKNPNLTPTRESEWHEKINILSTARPQIPEVDYIIPTFEWRKTKNGNTLRHRRMGGGLRIYIKRPWYSTGIDEMLAIVLPTNQGVKVMGRDLSNRYGDSFTHWAIDPILFSTQTEKVSPQNSDFRMNPVLDDQLQYPGTNGKAAIAAYPVVFDEDKQMWYCDLAIDPKTVYFPFVKLALARYQPYSVKKDNEDVCLSPVVMAPFVQLVPERQTTVQFGANKSKMIVKVEGSIFNERYAKWGNTAILRISFVDQLLSTPIEGIVDRGNTSKKLMDETIEIDISQGRSIQNNKYVVEQEISLPAEYASKPYQILIEEYERGPVKKTGDNIPDKYTTQMVQSEETDRLIYADIFTVNN
jgi:hypothetical protein